MGLAKDRDVVKYCDEDAYFYIQTPCVIPSQKITITMLKGLVIACITVGIILFSITYIQYIRSVQQFKYLDFDFNTLSTSDYSIEFQIKKKMWDNFL